MKKKAITQKKSISQENLERGVQLHEESRLFSRLDGWVIISNQLSMGKGCGAKVSKGGRIWLNSNMEYTPEQWAHMIAHCQLHLAFGHFDAERMPGYEKIDENGNYRINCNQNLWNIACDIYVEKFLADMKYGKAIVNGLSTFTGSLSDEIKIYDYLVEQHWSETDQYFGTGLPGKRDMIGLEEPLVYLKNKKNASVTRFAYVLASTVSDIVGETGLNVGEYNLLSPKVAEAVNWFMSSYPLLGGFTIVEDYEFCIREEIQIAAVDTERGQIYINPASGLMKEEWKFVLAHEYLHAGLCHSERCQGRDPFLWNVACDYVINGWLHDMMIGEMPEGALYDEELKDLSAEMIYEQIIANLKKYSRLDTFHGYGKGDVIKNPYGSYAKGKNGTSLDDFYRSALTQGLEYQKATGRGYIPAGLIEEIRALAVPPIPWDVELAEWFEQYFPEIEKKRSYARPSRRQSSTPDIPRPGYTVDKALSEGRTFGVVVDTSGSMNTRLLGMALGAIASYAASKEVPYARVVFCDAAAYDAGYLAPEEIAGRVEVKGRGGTVLQPGIDLLETAKDFPKDGQILIITDGYIESKLMVHREHAYLIPKGRYLPFNAKGKVFYFE